MLHKYKWFILVPVLLIGGYLVFRYFAPKKDAKKSAETSEKKGLTYKMKQMLKAS